MSHNPTALHWRVAGLATRRSAWVVLTWAVIAVSVNLLVPQLETVVAEDSTPVLPVDAPSSEAVALMDSTFGNGRSNSFLVVVCERQGGLVAADTRHIQGLAERLEALPGVTFVQDLRKDVFREAVTSKDGESLYFQVGIKGNTGAPAAIEQVSQVRESTRDEAPAGLTIFVTGPSATVSDLAVEAESSILTITLVTVGLIFMLLLLIYRRLSVALVALVTVGLSLALARSATAYFGLKDAFDVSTFTGSFLTAVVLGAGTDYAVFLIGRYHEQRRLGVPAADAARRAGGRVASVVIGSALTVALANACLLFADLGVFTTTGPAIAVSVAVTLLVTLTLLPALLAALGPRGFFEPRHTASGSAWGRVAALAVYRPVKVAAAVILPLGMLASLVPLLDSSFDSRSTQPATTESNRGYALIAEHFPINEVLPEYVLISSDRDLRNPKDLATLERAASAVSLVPGVQTVRSVTRPDGRPIERARVAYQAGIVGRRLQQVGEKLTEGQGGARELATGTSRLNEGASALAAGALRAASGAGRLSVGFSDLRQGLASLQEGASRAATGSQRLRDGARLLAAGLATAASQTETAVDALGQVSQALDSSLPCGVDPVCRRARDGLRQIHSGQRTRLLPGLRQAASASAALASGTTDLSTGLQRLEEGLSRAEDGALRISTAQGALRAGLGDLSAGTRDLAEGTSRVAEGTEGTARQVGELRDGLIRAADYLTTTSARANSASMGGFYLPPATLDSPRFSNVASLFVSRDGRIARIAVLGSDDAFGDAASSRSSEVREALNHALSESRLSDSDIMSTGLGSSNADLEKLAAQDFNLVVVVALVTVLIILIILLHAVVAPIILLLTVVLTYAAALGIGVLVFQLLLGQDIEWSIPALAFILLVAVGADYNLLLAKRMLEEAPSGDRSGLVTATAATGGVISAAGVIFAASMFALMAASVSTLVQAGFIIGVGLLIDTFLVRPLLVPALASILGSRMWWPRAPRVQPLPETRS